MDLTRLLLDSYLDAHILLACGWLVWMAIKAGLAGAGLGRAWHLRLALLQGSLVLVAVAPAVGLGLGWVLSEIAPGAPLSFADLAVAQYLEGNVRMDPQRLEALLGLRGQLLDHVVQLRSPLAIAAILAWSAGVLWFGLAGVRRVLRLLALCRGSFLWHRVGAVEVRLSDRISVPFCTRLLGRRIVFLPERILERPRHARIAVAHEFQHLRRGDVEWEFALELLRPLFFFNPAFLLWKREIGHLRELSCDASLLGARRVSARDYLGCLLKICEDSLTHDRRTFVVTPQVPLVHGRRLLGGCGASLLKKRVMAALECDGAPGAYRLPSAISVAALAVAFALLAVGLQRPADWSQDRLMLSTIVNLERLEARNAALQRLGNY